MDTNKVLSAISYFSVLFAGIILPLVLYFVAEDARVKSHAKKALLSHLLLLIPIPLIVISIFFDVAASNATGFPVFITISGGLSIILSIVVLIWNIVKGIKVLKNE